MEKDFDLLEEEKMNIVRQNCVLLNEFYDEEISNEFFIMAPLDINDLYNQN